MGPRAKKILWILPAASLLCLGTYEGAAVVSAKARTAEILREVSVRPLSLRSIPRRRLDMLLTVEDPGFYRHSGVDLSTPGQGMTSLTQSLVKLLYFDRFEPGFAKIEQSLIARFVLHPALSKDEQLEVFLNRAHFGSRGGRAIIGFADAASAYYGREISSLGDDEFLGLVAMLIAPEDFDPVRNRSANWERVRRIKLLLAGRCKPTGLRDVHYETCTAS